MAWTRRRAIVLTAWLVSVLGAHYIGGLVGFNQGRATELALSGSHAIETVTVLRLLRSSRAPDALTFLEQQLDGEIASSVFGEHAYNSPYNWPMRWAFPDAPAGNAYLLSQVLEYREQYPPVSPDHALNARLMRALASYRGAPRPTRF